jgi:hypothetical protein
MCHSTTTTIIIIIIIIIDVHLPEDGDWPKHVGGIK